jgi:hypothetical protein
MTVRYTGVTVVLQWCYSGVKRCDQVITMVLQWCDRYLVPRQAAVLVLITHLAAGGKW